MSARSNVRPRQSRSTRKPTISTASIREGMTIATADMIAAVQVARVTHLDNGDAEVYTTGAQYVSIHVDARVTLI